MLSGLFKLHIEEGILFRILFRKLFTKLNWPDWVRVWPANDPSTEYWKTIWTLYHQLRLREDKVTNCSIQQISSLLSIPLASCCWYNVMFSCKIQIIILLSFISCNFILSTATDFWEYSRVPRRLERRMWFVSLFPIPISVQMKKVCLYMLYVITRYW